MRNVLTLIMSMLCMPCLGQAQKSSARVNLPEDVVKDTIQLIQFSTNTFAVRWTYTEAGAKKAIASWEANGAHNGVTAEWKKGWLKHPTTKHFFRSKASAEELVARLKSK
jgi:hypothetical protein